VSTDFERLAQFPGSGCEKYDRRAAIFGREDVLPLWVADMDFPAPDFITRALEQRLSHPAFGYVKPDQRYFDAITHWLESQHHWKPKPDSIVPVAGVVPGMSMAINAFTQVDEPVIIQPPVYFPFFGVVQDNARLLLQNPLVLKAGFYRINFEQLEAQAADASMLLLSNPHNPGGRAWNADELARLISICKRHDVLVVADEIHMDLTYEGVVFTPFAKVAREQGFTNWIMLTAPGKTFNTAGIGGGYAVIEDARLRKAFCKEKQRWHLNDTTVFSQTALIAAYEQGGSWPGELMQFIAQNRDRVEAALKDTPIDVLTAEATYLLWLDCRKLGFSDPATDPQDLGLQNFFIEQAGLGLSQGIIFGEPGRGFMRLNLATPSRIIDQAMTQLHRALSEL